MTGSRVYRVRPSPTFESSLKAVIKKHCKKNPAAREEIEQIVTDLLKALVVIPKQIENASPEPFPKGHALPGWDFFKLRIYLSKLNGAAGLLRTMWLLNEETLTVVPFYIYTHAQFQGRPPARELAAIFRGIRLLDEVSD